jgi:hypothetical protein
MRIVRSILVAIVALALSLPALAGVNAWLDRNQVEPGDTVQLTLQRDGQGGGDPDISPLRRDFDIIGTSSGSSVRIINGNVSSQRQVSVTLSPKHAGSIPVPALDWAGERTPALALTVGGAGGSARGGAATGAARPRVYLETSVEPKQPYVQAATTVTVRLYAAEPLYQANLDLPQGSDALVQKLGDDSQTSETVGGREYRVITRKYLIFPQHSGQLRLDGPVLEAQVADRTQQGLFGADPMFGNFFGNSPFGGMVASRPLRLHGNDIELDVRPRPAAAGTGDWLPARTLRLSEDWNPAGNDIQVGSPITRRIVVQAEGLTAAQLPDLGAHITAPDGFKVYPDQARLNTTVKADEVVGTREQNIAFIADRAGTVTVPAVRVAWWDTVANAAREATLPARSFHVLPAPAGAGAAPGAATAPRSLPPPSPQASRPAQAHAPAASVVSVSPATGMGPWISLSLAVAWIATLAAWWWSRRHGRPATANRADAAPVKTPGTMSSAAARKALLQACRANDARSARQHLVAWQAALHPHDGPGGLHGIARRCADPRFRTLLRELDRACYGGGEWRGVEFAAALDECREEHSTDSVDQNLPPLYA